jgi:hypothetical protein
LSDVVPAVGRGVVRAGRGYRLYMAGLLFLVYVVHHLDRNVLLLLQEPIRK